jgi:hypothetical protein
MDSHRPKPATDRDRADPWADVEAADRPSQTRTDLPSPDDVAENGSRQDHPADD